jgi:hypothetical protein
MSAARGNTHGARDINGPLGDMNIPSGDIHIPFDGRE